MSLKNEYIELFDLYIQNKMSEVEKADFESKIQADTELGKEFELYKLLIDGVRQNERIELKNFMKQNRSTMFWGQNIWPKSVTYTAAAVLILFLGTYIVTRQYVDEPKPNVLTAINEKSIVKDSNLRSVAPEIELDSSTVNVDLAINETRLNPTPELNRELEFILEEEEDVPGFDDEYLTPMTPIEFNTSDKNYEVASDIKVKDTIIYLTILEKAFKLQSDYNVPSAVNATTITTKNKAIISPSPSYDESKKRAKAKVDTSASKQEEDLDSKVADGAGKVSKQGKEINNTQYKIEIWHSPINFEGYSYTGNNFLKLYIQENKKYQLYIYNQIIYLKYNSKVYQITYCASTCEFNEVTNDEIKKVILNSK